MIGEGPGIPTVGPANGVGWRLRSKGRGWDFEDKDPRGREDREPEAGSRAPVLLPLGPDREPGEPSPYVELHCHSCYSFREGASTPRELLVRAAALGYPALALTDRDGLYGAMELAKAAEVAGVRAITGADVTLQGGYRLVLLAETREGYANLCRLLSHAHLATASIPDEDGVVRIGVRPEVPAPEIPMPLLAEHAEGLIALSGCAEGEVPSLVAAGQLGRAATAARRYAEWFGPRSFYIELQQTLTLGEQQRNVDLVALARQLGLGVVATNDVWYHARDRHRLHDVMVAIRHRGTLDGSHRLRHANSEHFLKSAAELEELFEWVPEAMANTAAIAERCQFDLVRDLGYEFPHAEVPPGETPDSHLEGICLEALDRKYPREARGPFSPPPQPFGKLRAGSSPIEGEGVCLGSPVEGEEALSARAQAVERLGEELGLIRKHGLAGFFLAYYELLRLAGEIAGMLKGRDTSLPPDERPVGRGRGSSVSSIVCYLIGLSHIDPIANELFLGRFLNEELHSVPDIDLDFPRDVREELLKRIWGQFEAGRAALVCAYSTYHTRSAIRDVGKVLGLPALELDHLAKLSDSWGSDGVAREMARLPEYRAKVDAPLWRDMVQICQQIVGMPRHATQHVGGVVLSSRPLQEIVPLEPTRMEGRVMCHWDKDSVDDARMVKIDFLALGMLSLVDECLDTIERRHGQRPDLGRIPHDDPRVYDSICEGDTIGLFQIESRAQIATLAHTQPRTLDDLAVQVAIVRPGPIVSGAFRPYMEYRRRLREGEPVGVEYIHPFLEPVLKDTLGVVLYQEQVVQVAMAIAGYSAGEADRLRRNLNRRRGAELATEDWPELLRRAEERGVPEEAARASFNAILGFAAYGFPKSHAVAFGLLAYESAWLRFNYPAEYYAGLFNNQPMGFYSTEVIAGDARRHGIELARPDVNLSQAGCTVETDRRIRLGLAEVKGVGKDVAVRMVAEREASGPFLSLRDCLRRTGLRPEAVENLVLAGAFDGEALACDGEAPPQVAEKPSPRRELLWELGLVRERRGGYSARQAELPLPVEQDMVGLPAMSRWEEMAGEYEVMGLSPADHAMALLRPSLMQAGRRGRLQTSAEVAQLPSGAPVCMAGVVTCRQRPSTAKGVVFVSLEDEYGLANVVVYPGLFDRQRALILNEPFLLVRGKAQRQGTVVHVVAQRFERPEVQTDRLIRVSHDFH